MSQSATIIKNAKSILTGYTNNSDFGFYSLSQMSNAYKGAYDGESTYAYLWLHEGTTLANTRSQAYLEFDTSVFANIPNDATINEITWQITYATSGVTTSSWISNRKNQIMLISASTSGSGYLAVISAATNDNTFGTYRTVISNPSQYTPSVLSQLRISIETYAAAANTDAFIRLAGTDIFVVYTYNGVKYAVTTSNSTSSTVWPSGATTATALWVNGGENASVYVLPSGTLNEIIVKDNDVESTSSLITTTGGSVTLYPTNLLGVTGGTEEVLSATSAYTSFESNNYAALTVTRDAGPPMYAMWGFDTSAIPSNATITSITCKARVGMSSSRIYCQTQLYAGSTAKGSATSIATSAITVYNLTPGTWTRGELENIGIRLAITGATWQSTTGATLGFFGADLTVNFTLPNGTYMYTISNIAADHQIQVMDTKRAMMKIGDSWWPMSKVYKKVGNVWVQEQNPVDWFDDGTVYIPGY